MALQSTITTRQAGRSTRERRERQHRAEIRLSEIVSAVDGPISLGDFGEPHQNGACDHEGQCVLTHVWNIAGEYMRAHLASYTLANIAEMARGNAPWPLSLDTSDAGALDDVVTTS